MALITCKECKKEVSDTADKCPSCGAKVPKKLSVVHWIGIAIAGLIVVAIFLPGKNGTPNGSASSGSSSPSSSEEVAIKITSTALAKEYDANEARADSKFKDKLLLVTGVVLDITKDVADSTVVELRGINEFSSVSAEMQESEEQKAIQLQKGAQVTVQCRGQGEILGSPMLGECTLIGSR